MTDETPDYATSLRPPGEIIPGGPDSGVDFGADDDPDTAANDEEVRHAGYDVDAVSGETAAVRPD